MHEQSGLDEGKDFGDAKVVSGMGLAHGKRGAKSGRAEWRNLAAVETESSAKMRNVSQAASCRPWCPSFRHHRRLMDFECAQDAGM